MSTVHPNDDNTAYNNEFGQWGQVEAMEIRPNKYESNWRARGCGEEKLGEAQEVGGPAGV